MMWKRPVMLSMLLSLCLCSCEESEEERRKQAARFTTAQSPQGEVLPPREDLGDFVREPKPEAKKSEPKLNFKTYRMYEGEDIRQVTEVSGRVLLLCFTAPWCDNSTRTSAAIQRLAATERGTLQAVEINADAYPQLAHKFKLTKVPTTLLYVEGLELRRIEGSFTEQGMRSYLYETFSSPNRLPQQ